MAHELTELVEGQHSFLSVREDAWHRLGQTVQENVNALEAMRLTNLLAWDVRKQELFTADENGQPIVMQGKFATVFTNPLTGKTQQLGVVGNHYTPIQNEEHADLLDSLVDESGAKIETLGSLRDGRDAFITMKLPKSLKIGGVDDIDLYIVALNSHDGSSAFRFMITPVRVVCKNTEQAAIRAAKSVFSIRHTVSAQANIAAARQALGLTFEYVDAFEAEAEQMIAQQITNDEFERIMKGIFGDPDKQSSTRGQTAAQTHLSAVTSLWNESATLDGVRNTAWGAYNVVTEYADHFVNVRTKRDVSAQRALRAVTNNNVIKLKQRAFATLAAV